MNTVFKLFSELFKTFPLYFIILFSLVFFESFLNAMSIVAIAPISDFLLGRANENATVITQYFEKMLSVIGIELNLLVSFLFFAGLIAVKSIVNFIRTYVVHVIRYDVVTHLLADTLGKFFRARFQFFSQGDMGVLLNSFQKEVVKVSDSFGLIAIFFANFLQLIAFLIVPFALSPTLTIIFLSIGGLAIVPCWIINKSIYRLGKRDTETSNVVTGILHESLTAAKLILGFGRQEYTVQRYREAFTKHSKVSIKVQTLQAGVSIFFEPLGIFAALFALYIGIKSGFSLSDMAMVLYALVRLTPMIGLIMRGKATIDGFVPAYEQLERLRRDAASMEEPQSGVEFDGFKKSFEFNNVFFSYPGRAPAIEGINLRIMKGRLTALVGKSGSGKTTAIDLILGLYKQDRGELLLDGLDLKEYDLNSYRNRLGYVPQETQLFNATVRENMQWSLPNASDQKIWNAFKLANADLFVNELPEKLNTVLGDRGIRLSSGQRQRLALARAIIRKPDILILDEATSALDTESERLIQQSIDSLTEEMTIVVIAHRLSTIRHADCVYVFDEGKIIEQGSYSELLQDSSSKLSKMVKWQAI